MKALLTRTIAALGAIAMLTLCGGAAARAQTSSQTSEDFEKYARTLREKALLKIEPTVTIPAANGPLDRTSYPWKTNIVTTTFTLGGKGEAGATAWDPDWSTNYGGFDNPDPTARRGYIPAAFVPRLNPFYIALPYNDVRGSTTKPEARVCIPWFKEAFVAEGQSVCRDRWVHIRRRDGRDCYAQWSDCGPFGSDHWQYVFGDERPKPNANKGSGLNVSPAVRDYLGLNSTDVADWQFVNFKDVPRGPWSQYGENNPFVQAGRHH